MGLFGGSSELEKLQKQYAKLMKEAHTLSQRDRAAGDRKVAESEEVLHKINALKQK